MMRNRPFAMMKPSGGAELREGPVPGALPPLGRVLGRHERRARPLPPAEREAWASRRMSSSSAAHQLICWKVGSTPIRNVAMPMVSRDATRVALRP